MEVKYSRIEIFRFTSHYEATKKGRLGVLFYIYSIKDLLKG